MKKRKILFLSILFIISILIVTFNMAASRNVSVVKKGVLDLSKTQFANDRMINLDGEWEFYWNKLLTPNDFRLNKNIKHTYMKVPGNWVQDSEGHQYPVRGIATYRLIIKNIPQHGFYMISKKNIRPASKIFVNGRLLLINGNPAFSKKDAVSGNMPQMAFFELKKSTAEIIIQDVNDQYVMGAIAKSIVFGDQRTLLRENRESVLFEIVIITILFAVGIFYLILYSMIRNFRKNEPATLAFAMNSVLFAAMNSTISERTISLLFPDLTLHRVFVIGYTLTYLSLLSLIILLNQIDMKILPEKLRKILIIVYGIYIAGVYFLPVGLFLQFSSSIMIVTSLLLAGTFVKVLYLYLKNEYLTRSFTFHTIFTFALFCFNVYGVELILYRLGVIQSMMIGFISILSFSMSLTVLLIYRYSHTYNQNEEISRNLTDAFYELNKISREAQRNEIAFLQAQIKPHFLFNAMSSIMSLCYTDGIKAGALLTNLANYLRSCFDIDLKSDVITLENELRLIQLYVEIEQERFGDRLQMEYRIDPQLGTYKMIPLIIEPLVENAIRHGILKKKEGGKVILTIKEKDRTLWIRVEDNGVGMNDSQAKLVMSKSESTAAGNSGQLEGHGVSLKNINDRLMQYYNEQLHIETKAGEGTRISFSIPFKVMQKGELK